MTDTEVKNDETKKDEVADKIADEKKNDETNVACDKTENVTNEKKPSDQANNGGDIVAQEQKINRQLEYYFGDSNLNRDKFLLEQINSNENGWVPLTVLLTFNRLAKLSTDIEFIANSIRKSDEGLIEVSEDGTKIRRHPERPIPEYNEERRKEIQSRTAYAKGFPLDSVMSNLIDYFQTFEKVDNVCMRKYLDKPTKTYKFKGSVLVTFSNKAQCAEFIGKDKIEYNGKELIRKWHEKYIEEKNLERKQKSKDDKKHKRDQESEKYHFHLPGGAVIHFEGAKEDSTTREHIKSAFELKGADVAFIDYSKGEKAGYVRLNGENTASEFIKKCDDNKIKLKEGDVELTLKLLEGDEEREFLKRAIDSMKSKRNKGRNKGGYKHSHYDKNRKRRGSGCDDDKPASKHGKVEAE